MTTWGEAKRRILVGLLKDEEGERYTDEQMSTYAAWALAEISAHTACADTKVYPCDGTVNCFPLPSDRIDPIDKAGLVIYEHGSKQRYLTHYKRMPGITWITGQSSAEVYYEFPGNHLTLGFMPSPGSKILLHYFRIWRPPQIDDDILEIPTWLEVPFSYFVAAFALEPIGTQAANIRQWNRKQDSGNPEDNPALQQVKHFINQAYRYLSKFAPQDRETFYKMQHDA